MNATAPEPTNTGPLAAAWRWSVEHSPILMVWRWADHRVHPQRLAAKRLAESGLPEPVRARITEIVRRTRLLATERDQVCRELVSHGAEALENPSDPAADAARVAESLGDPKAAAPLIRRAMKRKRSAFFQTRAWLLRATGWGFVTLVVLYSGLFIRFQMGSPSIKTDYLAMLNAPILATPESDRAIGIYQSVLADWKPHQAELRALPEAEFTDERGNIDTVSLVDHLPDIVKSDHPQFQAVRETLIAFRPELDRLSEASRRPIMGFLYSDQPESVEGTPLSVPESWPADGTLMGVLLPHLGQLRHIARLLAADARLAAMDGDGQRATDDLTAMANTARLLAPDPFLISDLVAVAIHNLASSEIRHHLADHPDLFTAEQLLTLSHTLSASAELVETTDLRGESYLFEDLLQRAFTDNGHGDGRLTPDGLTTLMGFSENGRIEPGAASKLAGPLSMEFVASRAELSALHRQHLDVARNTLARGPEALPELLQLAHELENLGPVEEGRVLPVTLVLPALTRAVESFMESRMRTDATLAALAAEHHRRLTGAYPDSLDQLVPAELPALPRDPFEPGTAMKYRLTETGPMIYVAGTDGDDDGGVRFEGDGSRNSRRSSIWAEQLSWRFPRPGCERDDIPDADWILFPPQDD